MEEKHQIGKHSIPRPEIDLLALDFAKNEVLIVDAKSFLRRSLRSHPPAQRKPIFCLVVSSNAAVTLRSTIRLEAREAFLPISRIRVPHPSLQTF